MAKDKLGSILSYSLYDATGKISYFRAFLLAVFAICMFCYGVTLYLSHHGLNKNDDSVVSVQNTQNSSSSIFTEIMQSEEEARAQVLAQKRVSALKEIEDGALFFSSCGNINAGFEGCSWSFSKAVLQDYDSKIETGADGFIITLKAKGEQKDDLCVFFSLDSNGNFVSYDKDGKDTDKCTPDFIKNKKVSNLSRITDSLEGMSAPSGNLPLEVKVATNDKKDSNIKQL